jgi:hypothetical protein
MLLALITLLFTADAHPTQHHSNAVIHITPPRTTYHWVSSHYNKWGRWIPGHWALDKNVETIVCATERNRTVCVTR